MHIKSTMTFFVAAFTTTTRVAGRQSKSKFIQNSGKLFSSTTMSSTDEHSSDSPLSKYFTVGLTGSDGLIGKSFRDEVRRIGTINDKPIRCVALKRGNYAEKKKTRRYDVYFPDMESPWKGRRRRCGSIRP